MLRDQRRTKIVCTLGPASDGDILPRLLAAGMNVARLNFSHGTHAEHGARIKRLRELAAAAGLPLAILQDLAGPKVRIGDVSGGEVTLREGEEFCLSAVPLKAGQAGVIVDYPQVITETPLGAPILLADGNIELRVEARTDTALNCRVVVGGVLRSHVGINFPMHSLSVSAFTDKDREDLRFGIAQGVDFIALSYVRSRQDILEAKEFMRSLGADIPIIAKIEKHEALSRLEEILDEADGLMVARGDLGVEIPLEQVPMVQKRIIDAANQVGKPVITATQMLLSMVTHSRPSRAEATDVANAILDGTDAVMLSEETAAGQFPVEAVKFLDRVSRVTEADFPHAAWLRDRAPLGTPGDSRGRQLCGLRDGPGPGGRGHSHQHRIWGHRPPHQPVSASHPHRGGDLPGGYLAPAEPLLGGFPPADPAHQGHGRDAPGGGGRGPQGRDAEPRRPGHHHHRHPHRHPGQHQPDQGGCHLVREIAAVSFYRESPPVGGVRSPAIMVEPGSGLARDNPKGG